MVDLVELTGKIEKAGDLLILNFPEGRGSISVKASDCEVSPIGIKLQVGTKISMRDTPSCDDKPDLAQYSELMTGTVDTYACIGAQPWINLPGAFIDCTTGKVLGKCYQSFPCT